MGVLERVIVHKTIKHYAHCASSLNAKLTGSWLQLNV